MPLSLQVKSYSNSTAWMLVETTHLTEFEYYVFRHFWSIPGLQPSEQDEDWVNDAVRFRLRGQVNRKTWKEVVEKDILDLESCH